ncbi:hypothetical protein GGI19_004446 [Coemansia pectinata]|uniref:DUF4246 domain-containing protein n=1 Tax=Coemansia pectinata TaxID=1052879 RepID=A0A9W8GXR7_9FUNG|nr:hypothetical protein GGI19_004446 [Coemansia pectinata]
MKGKHFGVYSPIRTLDERIRDRFPHGAVYHCEPRQMDTIYERRLRLMSSSIRSRPDWIENLNDSDACADWAAEAKAQKLTDLEFRYVLDVLAYYSSLHFPNSDLRFSAADGAWFSDTLIDAETTKKLRDYAAVLESVPDLQKDWHPDVRSRMLNLIDPSLYPLIYDRSWLCRQSSTAAGDSGPEYYLPVVVKKQALYASDKFSWLPSEFRVDDAGAVTIESYINNLHPVKHAALYPVIAHVFSKFLPLLEQVLTDLVHPHVPGVELDLYECYDYGGPEPERGRRPYYEYLEELECWEEDASYVDPKPKRFVAPERPVNPYKLRGRRLQAVVRMSNIELTSEKPTYGGKSWSVAGLDNERIIATGIFFYDVVNIAPCSLKFREPLNAYHSASKANYYHAIRFAYDINGDLSGRPARVSQELGDVDIKDGRCLVFPNTYQYTMPRITRELTSKPGHCKMLTFYFVNSSTRIPSTEIVPPHQKDWWAEGILSFEPFRSLPLVVDGIMAKIDYPISLKEAKDIRLQLEAEVKKKTANVSSKFFEPFYTLKTFKNDY